MDYKNKKLRIVKKEKDGITIKENGTSVKFSWDEFNAGYNIVDNVYAVMNDKMVEQMTQLDDLIDTATTAYFIMQNSVPDIKQLSYAAVLSETIEKIQKLLNCTGLDAMKLVKNRINAINNMFGSDKKSHSRDYYKKQRHEMNKDKFPKHVETSVNSTSCIMSDNPALMKLKETMCS